MTVQAIVIDDSSAMRTILRRIVTKLELLGLTAGVT
jgi:hypothetical protein